VISPGRLRGVIAAGGAILVLLLLNLQFLEARRSAGRRVGIMIDDAAAGVTITEVLPGSPADRAGLRPGDVVRAIGGSPLQRYTDYNELAQRFESGRSVSYRVERGGGESVVEVTPGMPVRWLRRLVMAVVVLGYLALALLALAQPQHDLRGTLLFGFAMAVALELAAPTNIVGNPGLERLADSVFFLISGLEIGLELHLVSLIPERHPWIAGRRWVIPAFYAGGLTTGALLAGIQLAESYGARWLPWSYEQALGLFNIALMPTWAIAVTGLLSYQSLRARSALGRQQAALVLAAELPWAGLTLVSAIDLALTGASPAWFELVEPPVLLAFPVVVFIAIFRYHLFDIELVVRRSMVYLALTGALVLIFYAAVGAGSALLSQWVGGGVSVLVVSATTLLVGLLFSPLHRSLQRLISRRLFPERHAQRQRLVELAAQLPAFGKVPLMGKHLVAQLGEIFATSTATVLVADPEGGVLVTVASTSVNPERDFDHSFLLSPDDPGVVYLRRAARPLPAQQVGERSASMAQRLSFFRASLVVPVMSHNDLIGVLLLGEKTNGEGYLGEETELLSLLSHHVASVFENARLFESATTDNLTGLLRRETVLAHLERELQRALRYGRPLTVGMADLDHFKEINDRHGHLVGDSMLKRVAQAITSGLRSADLVGRYGGEEFLFVLPESDGEGARVVAERIRRAVAEITLRIDARTTLTVTVSIGMASLAELGAESDDPVRDLIALADRRLLEAKAAGRDRIKACGGR
jgi:diguanylate cyclase (GGDEF)-like protein